MYCAFIYKFDSETPLKRTVKSTIYIQVEISIWSLHEYFHQTLLFLPEFTQDGSFF